MKTRYLIRILILIATLYPFTVHIYSQNISPMPEATLPSEQTYNEIQNNNPRLRLDGENELGGIDAPDPSEAPLKDDIYPLFLAGLAYILLKTNRIKRRSVRP